MFKILAQPNQQCSNKTISVPYEACLPGVFRRGSFHVCVGRDGTVWYGPNSMLLTTMFCADLVWYGRVRYGTVWRGMVQYLVHLPAPADGRSEKGAKANGATAAYAANPCYVAYSTQDCTQHKTHLILHTFLMHLDFCSQLQIW